MRLHCVAGLILFSVAANGQNPKVAATTRSQWSRINPVTPLTPATFATPPAADRPWVYENGRDGRHCKRERTCHPRHQGGDLEHHPQQRSHREKQCGRCSRRAGPDRHHQGLKPWPQIPALQFVAGLATYTATFDLPVTWAKGQGALLSLGEVFDTFSVTVNHQPVSVDQLSAEADLGAQLKPGRNTINVRVATTLNNRLASLDEDVKNRGFVQPYGLVGPVRITPYRTVPVSGR